MEKLVQIIVWIPPVVLAVTGHELAHGWVARRLGDPTAALQGRLSLNPIRHIDPVGTIIVPVLLALAGGFIFGWAKPVPVNWRMLRHPRRDMALVALAGPGANLVMIVLWVLLIAVVQGLAPGADLRTNPLIYMGWTGIIINSVLMVLNLVPIPPLDGSRVVSACLPAPLALQYNRLERFGLILVLALLAFGLLGQLLEAPLQLIERLVLAVLGP